MDVAALPYRSVDGAHGDGVGMLPVLELGTMNRYPPFHRQAIPTLNSSVELQNDVGACFGASRT